MGRTAVGRVCRQNFWLSGCGSEVSRPLAFVTPAILRQYEVSFEKITAIGEKIREILLNPEHPAMGTQAEVLLYMAARAQLWAEKIGPALQDNKCVVLDRWLSSTCAYQGCAGGFGMDKVVKIATDCLERVWPDLTIILDVDLETTSRRLGGQLDRMEAKGDNYHKRVREGFLQLAGEHEHVLVVNATGEIETVHEKVIQKVKGFF